MTLRGHIAVQAMLCIKTAKLVEDVVDRECFKIRIKVRLWACLWKRHVRILDSWSCPAQHMLDSGVRFLVVLFGRVSGSQANRRRHENMRIILAKTKSSADRRENTFTPPNFQENLILKRFIVFASGMLWAASLAPVSAAGGKVVLQLDMRNITVETNNIVLTALNGIRLAAQSAEWQVDPVAKAVVNTTGSGAAPFVVEAGPEASGKCMKTLFLVTTNAPAIRLFETIVASNERFRMAGREENELFNVEAIPDTGPFTVASWAVDLQPGATLSGGKKQMLEIVFSEPQKLEDMHFLSEGRDAWARAWRGGVLEWIGVDDIVSEPVREAVAHYFRLKHGLHHLNAQSTPEGRARAGAMGISFGNIFGTVYIVAQASSDRGENP